MLEYTDEKGLAMSVRTFEYKGDTGLGVRGLTLEYRDDTGLGVRDRTLEYTDDSGLGSHGVMVSTPGPTSRRRQLPVVPAGPEWHNTAASATPCATLRETPPPFPALSLSTPHGMGSYRTDHTAGPPCRSLCTRGPECIKFCQSNKFCTGTHPMPPVLPEVINSAWAHTQCLQFCQKE